jgi:hypothetical protein
MLRLATDPAVLGRLVGNPLIHVVNEESQAASNTLGLEKDRPNEGNAGSTPTIHENCERGWDFRCDTDCEGTAEESIAASSGGIRRGCAHHWPHLGERVRRTTERLDLCRSEGLAFPCVEGVRAHAQ